VLPACAAAALALVLAWPACAQHARGPAAAAASVLVPVTAVANVASVAV